VDHLEKAITRQMRKTTMFNDPDRTYSGRCCVDCLILLANGDAPAGLTEDETAEYLACVERETANSEITLGMFRENHECATNWLVTWYAPSDTRGSYRRGTADVRADSYADALDAAYWAHGTPACAWPVMARSHDLQTEDDRGGECYCEQFGFSTSSCDVCGSTLHGDRHAVVFWFGPDDSDRSEPESTQIGA
jgi:hypothetical protein